MSARSAVHGALALVFLLSAPAALADPAGKSTTDETIRPASGSGYVALERKSGEGYGIRRHPSARAFGPALARPDVARVLRPAHRPADRGRDVSGAGGLPRPGGQRGVVVVAPDGDLRAAGVRPDRAQHEREPDERGARAWRQVREARLRDHHRRSRGQPAAQRDALVQGRARRRDRRPVLRQGVSATNPCGGATADADRGDQRGGRGARLHRRGRLRRLARRPARALRRLLGPGRGGARGRALRRLPALPGAARARAEDVHRRGPEGPVVHRPRQPRRADPGQRAGEHRPLPLDRHRLPEGLPVGGGGPGRASRTPTRARSSRRSATPRTSRRSWRAPGPSRRTRTARSSRPSSTRRRSAARTATRTSPRPRTRRPAAPPPTTRSARARGSR